MANIPMDRVSASALNPHISETSLTDSLAGMADALDSLGHLLVDYECDLSPITESVYYAVRSLGQAARWEQQQLDGRKAVEQ